MDTNGTLPGQTVLVGEVVVVAVGEGCTPSLGLHLPRRLLVMVAGALIGCSDPPTFFRKCDVASVASIVVPVRRECMPKVGAYIGGCGVLCEVVV